MSEEQKFRGVFKHKDGGWTATIGHEGKNKYLGWYREFASPNKTITADTENHSEGSA